METCMIKLRKIMVLLVLGCFLGGLTLAPTAPALAQTRPNRRLRQKSPQRVKNRPKRKKKPRPPPPAAS